MSPMPHLRMPVAGGVVYTNTGTQSCLTATRTNMMVDGLGYRARQPFSCGQNSLLLMCVLAGGQCRTWKVLGTLSFPSGLAFFFHGDETWRTTCGMLLKDKGLVLLDFFKHFATRTHSVSCLIMKWFERKHTEVRNIVWVEAYFCWTVGDCSVDLFVFSTNGVHGGYDWKCQPRVYGCCYPRCAYFLYSSPKMLLRLVAVLWRPWSARSRWRGEVALAIYYNTATPAARPP